MIASSPLSRWVSIGEDETGINATLGDSRGFSTFAAFALVPARLVFAVLCLVALRLARTPLTKISPPSCELNCPRFLPFPLFGSWTRRGRRVEAGGGDVSRDAFLRNRRFRTSVWYRRRRTIDRSWENNDKSMQHEPSVDRCAHDLHQCSLAGFAFG